MKYGVGARELAAGCGLLGARPDNANRNAGKGGNSNAHLGQKAAAASSDT